MVIFTSSLHHQNHHHQHHHHHHHHHHRQILFHLRSQFHAIWGSHKCEVKGCGQWLTCDGGMKPRRYLNCIYCNEIVFFFSNVCAARYSGVKTYKHSATRVVSGCTQKPSPGHQVRWKEGGKDRRLAWRIIYKQTLSNIICSSVLIISTTRVQWCWQKISRMRQRPN